MKKWLEKTGLIKRMPEPKSIDLSECKFPVFTSGGWFIGMAWKYEPEMTQYLLWTKPHGSC